jgi:hypothetical protein
LKECHHVASITSRFILPDRTALKTAAPDIPIQLD